MLGNADDLPSSEGETSNTAAHYKIIKGDIGEFRCLNCRHGFLSTGSKVQRILVKQTCSQLSLYDGYLDLEVINGKLNGRLSGPDLDDSCASA